MICPNCGHESKENDRFCVMCATKLVPTAEEIDSAAKAAVSELDRLEAPFEPAPVPSAIAEEPEVSTLDEAFAPQEEAPAPVIEDPRDNVQTCTRTEANDKPLTTWGFIWRILLISIPIFNIIPLFVFAFASGINKNSRGFARAILIIMLVSLIIALIGAAVLLFVYNGQSLVDSIRGFFTQGHA